MTYGKITDASCIDIARKWCVRIRCDGAVYSIDSGGNVFIVESITGDCKIHSSGGISDIGAQIENDWHRSGLEACLVIKGAMSPIGLYCKLFKMADKGKVVVFDDCDSIFQDDLSLNILKAALDSKKNRWIHWNTDSFKLRNEGVPDKFKFEASAIFITNLKFDKVKGKLREHWEALESRCHYMDLTIDTEKDKVLRIKQVVQDGMLDDRKLEDDVKVDIMDFVEMNMSKLRELSLRTVLKVADLAEAFPNKWEAMAENTVMRRA